MSKMHFDESAFTFRFARTVECYTLRQLNLFLSHESTISIYFHFSLVPRVIFTFDIYAIEFTSLFSEAKLKFSVQIYFNLLSLRFSFGFSFRFAHWISNSLRSVFWISTECLEWYFFLLYEDYIVHYARRKKEKNTTSKWFQVFCTVIKETSRLCSNSDNCSKILNWY